MSDEIVVSQDENGRTAEVKISDKTSVVFKEIGGRETRFVERMTGNDAHMLARNLALFALVSINGEKLLDVKNDMHLDSRAAKFSMVDYFTLPRLYDKAFSIEGDLPND